MKADTDDIEQLKDIHKRLEHEIEARLKEFELIWLHGDDERLFAELVFCILTPQSRARSCWAAVESLFSTGRVYCQSDAIHPMLEGVRFKYRKAEYICEARDLFSVDGRLSIRAFLKGDVLSMREWLVENVKGLGYKEASHFLRNIGIGRDLAILDRHILRRLVRYGVISSMPESLSRSRYLEIEGSMSDFARRIDIPMSHLDMVFWYMGTGEIFK